MTAAERAKQRKALRQKINQFWAAELAEHAIATDKGLHVSGVFLDSKEGLPRVVVVCHTDCDAAAIEAKVSQYFRDHPTKMIYRDERPQATIDAGRPILDALGGFGTLGGFFQKDGVGPILGISNNHVLAGCDALRTGQPIRDTFGNLIGSLAFAATLNPPPGNNVADVALVTLNEGVKGIWRPRVPVGFIPPREGLQVTKQGGATAGPTLGVVKSSGFVNMRLCGQRVFQFRDVVAVEGSGGAFSVPGDSGSVVMTQNGFIVGLLFGVMGDFSYMVPFTALRPLRLQISP